MKKKSPAVLLALFTLIGIGSALAQSPASLLASPPPSLQAACCNPALEPGHPGQQFCAQGHACCATGAWQCHDALGQATCLSTASSCVPPCCDPLDEPGSFSNPPCIEGATCCASGDWQCNNGDGTSSCGAIGSSCAQQCCDPSNEPGLFGNPACIEGATCCSTGAWQCNAGNGGSSCALDGAPCPTCCDPAQQPGVGSGPPCIEGSSCCADGTWQCNAANGGSTCSIDGVVCQPRCCDPNDEPGLPGNPHCFEGATCCATGRWQCNDPGANSTCDADGVACPRCCNPADEPGQFGNPTCFEGATCCASGQWQCNDAGANSTCAVDGLACESCCAPENEPGQVGNPPCIEGSSCCSTGEWQCNEGNGSSTCALDGFACEPRCCDPALLPNSTGNAFCASGFTCCADGTWRCNTDTGAHACPGDPGHECPEICGGFAGLACSDPNDFCKLNVGECCCDFFGVCTDVPQACPANYDPVCGCDGVTYGNECEADRAGASIEHLGPCPEICGGFAGFQCSDPNDFCKLNVGECCCDFFGVCTDVPQACPDNYDPVCGCDGLTYGNACEADQAGVSIEHLGPCLQVCGGIAGILCDKGEFCLFPEGECCCDQTGSCAPLPQACPAVCDPVCGCDGRTYGNECEAYAAGVSIDHQGACFAGGGLVSGVRFTSRDRMVWDRTPGALAYNVYRKVIVLPPPDDAGDCIAPSLLEPELGIPFDPGPHRVWLFQVSAEFPEGEGPLGVSDDCTERQPARRCACELPADPGPCDGAFPRWFHNPETGQCEPFVWGGCGGNANNFATQEECRSFCHVPSPAARRAEPPAARERRRPR